MASSRSGWSRAIGLVAAVVVASGFASPACAADERPLLVAEQGAHSAPVRRIDVHAARGLVVTASDDRTARVWDLASGELRHILRPPAFGAEGGRLYGAAIHPSEPIVAVAGTTGGEGRAHRIYLFDLESGALQRTIDAQAGDVRKLAWSSDGSLLLAGYAGVNGFRAFGLDGRVVADERFDGPVFGIAASKNGLAAVASLDGRLRVYRAAAGSIAAQANIALGNRRAAGVAFSPDGRRIAIGYAEPGEAVELFDADSGRSAGRLPLAAMHGGDFRVVAWSADGRSIYAAGTARTRDDAYPIVQHDAASGALTGQVNVARDSVTDLVALPSGELAYSGFDGSWGVVSHGRVVRSIAADVATIRGDTPEDLELSADALAVRWGMKSARGGFGFEFDRRKLSVGASRPMRPPELRFSAFDAPSDWNHARNAPVVGGKTLALAQDERSRALVVMRSARSAVIGTNRALYKLSDKGDVQWRVPVDTEVRAVNASDDARVLVSAMADGTLRWWRARDGVHLLTLLGKADGRWVVWTPSGYYDASAGADRVVGWALGRDPQQPMDFYTLNRFRDRFNRPDVISAVMATLDEQAALQSLIARDEASRAAAASDAKAREEAARVAERAALDATEQARLAQAREAEARVAAVQAAAQAAAKAELAREAEARRLAAREQAQREAAAREAAARQAEAREAQARESAQKQLALEAEGLSLALAAARENAAREAVLQDLVAKEAAREASEREAAARERRRLAEIKATQFPPALLASEAKRIQLGAPEVTLPFAVASSGPAADLTVEIRINGRPAQPLDLVMPQQLDGAARGFAKLGVAEGESTIEIIARNQYGVSEPLSFRIERAATAESRGLTAARPTGDLYVLAIGISEYSRADYKLGLAAKDAQDFANAMRSQEGKQYRRVIVRTLSNREATRANILREFDWLRSTATPSDVAMLFMAGHGLNDSTGQYFFLPYDGAHERLMSSAVSQAAIVATLSKIRGKTLFFVDTCFAGNTLGALRQAGRQTEKMMNDLSSSENGVVVFASSTGQEESEEKAEWGNGAFTKALIDGLKGKADFTRAGRVTYAALNLFVSEEVGRITEGRQRPVFISPRGIPDFALARL